MKIMKAVATVDIEEKCEEDPDKKKSRTMNLKKIGTYENTVRDGELKHIQDYTVISDNAAFNSWRQERRRLRKPLTQVRFTNDTDSKDRGGKETKLKRAKLPENVQCVVAKLAYKDADSFEYKRVRTLEKLRRWGRTEKLFAEFDSDGDGSVSLEEFTHGLLNVLREATKDWEGGEEEEKEHLTEDEVRKLWDEADTDGNGTLDAEEFKAWLSSIFDNPGEKKERKSAKKAKKKKKKKKKDGEPSTKESEQAPRKSSLYKTEEMQASTKLRRGRRDRVSLFSVSKLEPIARYDPTLSASAPTTSEGSWKTLPLQTSPLA